MWPRAARDSKLRTCAPFSTTVRTARLILESAKSGEKISPSAWGTGRQLPTGAAELRDR